MKLDIGWIFLCVMGVISLQPRTAVGGEVYGEILKIQGEALLLRGETEISPHEKMQVEIEDVLQTRAGARVHLKLVSGATVIVGHNTKIKLTPPEKKEDGLLHTLEVGYGRVRAMIEKDKGDEKDKPSPEAVASAPFKFKVNTPTAVTGVRGTDFFVNYNSKTELSKVLCFEGVVAVKAPQMADFQNLMAGYGTYLNKMGLASEIFRVSPQIKEKSTLEKPVENFKPEEVVQGLTKPLIIAPPPKNAEEMAMPQDAKHISRVLADPRVMGSARVTISLEVIGSGN